MSEAVSNTRHTEADKKVDNETKRLINIDSR